MQLPARTENQHLAEAVAGKLGRGVSEVSEPFVTSQKAVFFFYNKHKTHTHKCKEKWRSMMCQRLLNSSAVSPSHKEFCGCAAMPAVIFFYYPKLTVLWHFLKTKPFPTSFVYFLALSIFLPPTKSQSQHQRHVPSLLSPWSRLRWPSAALERLPVSLAGTAGSQSVCRREGGQLAAGRTTPTLVFFCPLSYQEP